MRLYQKHRTIRAPYCYGTGNLVFRNAFALLKGINIGISTLWKYVCWAHGFRHFRINDKRFYNLCNPTRGIPNDVASIRMIGIYNTYVLSRMLSCIPAGIRIYNAKCSIHFACHKRTLKRKFDK